MRHNATTNEDRALLQLAEQVAERHISNRAAAIRREQQGLLDAHRGAAVLDHPAGSVDGTKIALAVAGDGLGHTGSALQVNVDGTTIEIVADALQINPAVLITAGAGLYLHDGKLSTYHVASTGERYVDIAATYPATWSEIVACPVHSIARDGWSIGNAAGVDTWQYRTATNGDMSGDGVYHYRYRAVRWWDGGHDISYYLALHNGSGGFDATRFVRLHLQRSSGAWRVRGEHGDGATQQSGTWVDLPAIFPQPFYVDIVVQIASGAMSYVGVAVDTHGQFSGGQISLHGASVSFAMDVPYFDIVMSRTTGDAGKDASLIIGAIDHVTEV